MGIMDIVGGIAHALQVPQSVATGGTMGLLRALGQDSGFDRSTYDNFRGQLDELQKQGYDTSDLEKQLLGGLRGVTNPLQGITKGLSEGFRPSDVTKQEQDPFMAPTASQKPGVLGQVSNTVMDLGLDPLLFAGAAAKPLAAAGRGGKAVKALDTAFSAGKLGEDATRAERLSAALMRGARRSYQGTVATGDPLTGLGAGMLMGVGENKLARLMPQALGRAAQRFESEVDNIPSAVQVKGQPVATIGSEIEPYLGTGTRLNADALVPDQVFPQGFKLPTEQLGLPPEAGARMMPEGLGPIAGGPGSPLNLPEQTIQEILGRNNPLEMVENLQPRRVLVDPMIQGTSRQDILNQLDEILRSR